MPIAALSTLIVLGKSLTVIVRKELNSLTVKCRILFYVRTNIVSRDWNPVSTNVTGRQYHDIL